MTMLVSWKQAHWWMMNLIFVRLHCANTNTIYSVRIVCIYKRRFMMYYMQHHHFFTNSCCLLILANLASHPSTLVQTLISFRIVRWATWLEVFSKADMMLWLRNIVLASTGQQIKCICHNKLWVAFLDLMSTYLTNNMMSTKIIQTSKDTKMSVCKLFGWKSMLYQALTALSHFLWFRKQFHCQCFAYSKRIMSAASML